MWLALVVLLLSNGHLGSAIKPTFNQTACMVALDAMVQEKPEGSEVWATLCLSPPPGTMQDRPDPRA